MPGQIESNRIYSTAIVLGGFSNQDKNGNGAFNAHADRFEQGVKLLKMGKVAHIMITSGNGNLTKDIAPEAPWVKKQLEKRNVPDSVIIIEQNSRNTVENAKFSKVILDREHLKPPYLLVTSAFHMRRAAYIFKKTGINIIPYPCDYIVGMSRPSLFDYLLPDTHTPDLWGYYIKEMIGLAITHLKL